jgi:peptide/nickel transport system substrate-binding protein
MIGLPRARRRTVLVSAGMLGVCLVAAGCSGNHTSNNGNSTPSTQSGGAPPTTQAAVLNYQFVGPPLGLNPALNGQGDSSNFTALDYDSLIYQAPNGSFQPDLATSWHYVGSGNKAFELTLRSGVKFTDGSALTAQAVKNSLDYYRSVEGPEQSLTSALKSVTVTGPMSVELHFSQPVPDVPLLLSAEYEAGAIIGPKGLADPSSLSNASDGAGQYIYDPSASVTNSVYTYNANPHYWNPAAVHYKKVVIRILGQPSSVLSALQSGQLDAATGSGATVTEAKNSGMNVVTTPFASWTLILADRAGVVSKPLADVRVRQAINYAIDRAGIIKAVAGGYGTATDEPMSAVNSAAYDQADANYYAYNLQKAKALMAAAGYAKGFTLPVLAEGILDPNDEIIQAVASNLAQIGITVKLTSVSASLSQFFGDALSKQYPAIFWLTGGGNDAYTSGQQYLPTVGTPENPFGSTDSQVTTLYNEANAAPASQQPALYQQVEDRLVKLAWFAPVYQSENFYYFRSNVKNTMWSLTKPTLMVVAPVPGDGWFS